MDGNFQAIEGESISSEWWTIMSRRNTEHKPNTSDAHQSDELNVDETLDSQAQ